MIQVTTKSLKLAAAASLALLADPGRELQVLRFVPAADAAPTAAITVTFDRPVAGSLDRTVDPRKLFSIEPAVAGEVEWRDPVTLRFRPATPLPADGSFTVTISDQFEAMDGSRLAEPYVHAFRVRGARILAGAPVGPSERSRYLAPDSRLELVVDAPADSALVSRSVYLEFNRLCRTPGAVRLSLEAQRPITAEDRWDFREAGGWDRDRSADPLRRVLRLAPRTPLPHGCAGHLVVPASFDERGRTQPQRWEFATYGDFKVVSARCSWGGTVCPTGPLVVRFSTPVRGADVLRGVTIRPAAKFAVADTNDVRPDWVLDAELRPRTGYAVIADRSLTDGFGQRLSGNPVATMTTTGYAPAIDYPSGRALVEARGARTFGVTYVNVDTLEVLIAPIPDSLESAFLARSEWNWRELWPSLLPGAMRRRIAVRGERDRTRVYGIPIEVPPTPGRRRPALMAVQVTSARLDSASRAFRPIALVQVSDLGVHARVGTEDAAVWVTGAEDGRPRAGATVTLHDGKGRVLGRTRTDTAGLARLEHFARPPIDTIADEELRWSGFQGYVAVELGEDRAVLGINDYDPDLSPWRFNVTSAWGSDRYPAAVALFTERGIYRPGEPLFAKAIVRTGPLGALQKPAAGDSLRWVFHDRADETGEAGVLRDTTVALSAFGTAEQRFEIPAGAALGQYRIAAQLRREERWTELSQASYRVAEYRPPEFLVDVATDSGARFARDSMGAAVEARYLFGAPMGRAAVRWSLRQESLLYGGVEIPGAEGYYIGDSGWWYEELAEPRAPVQVPASGIDTLDGTGRLSLRVQLGETDRGRPSRATFEATVTDVNRQTVSSSSSVIVHPAAFYIGAKSEGESWFWTAGKPAALAVIAVRPDGGRVTGAKVEGVVVRREWHQVRRERGGYAELVGEWVSDTVARCTVTTAAEPAPCRFTPGAGGSYIVTFRSSDEAGREVSTSVYRWAVGSDWVPWNDESQFKMDVVPDRTRYSVGDTATVLFASPFTGAEAWVTLEREGLIEQRRMRIESGTTTLKIPITEALAPNVFVSIVVARGRSAKPGPLDDPGRPTIRVGYAELRVTPERKRLAVRVSPLSKEYRPGDTARVAIAVQDADGNGRSSEVTLWAVDEGVLALTGFETPDPLDLLYRPRGLGLRLASTLTTVTPQVPEGEKGKRAPGGGGGADAADILRSRFQTTAFFLGSLVTNAQGRGVASARLPDNLTTFRVMAVAVTEADRYGSGQSSMLVTRPLVARPALPRFLREGDRFAAGVVVNRRDGRSAKAKVEARAIGVRLEGRKSREVTLEAGRGREVRFDFLAGPGDSLAQAGFRFNAKSDGDADAVALTLPVRPFHHPQAFTVAGVLHDSTHAMIELPPDVDPARSTLTLSLGTSPLAMIRGVHERFRVYPYWCSEQIASAAEPLLALYRAGPELGADSAATRRARADLERVIATLARRQRPDGGIGLWSATDWTTPWLTAYAGAVLLDAQVAGFAVDDSVLARIGGYLQRSLAERGPILAPVQAWYDSAHVRLSERVMAVDYLSRAGLRDRAAENELLRLVAQLAWEDRVRLAHILARGDDRQAARQLLEPAWREVVVEGRTATLPKASRRSFYFYSPIRPAAWLLSATLAVDPSHRLVGPLVETLLQKGRGADWTWNTQDLGTAVSALADYQRHQRTGAARGVRVASGRKTVLQVESLGAASQTSIALDRLAGGGPVNGKLDLSLSAGSGSAAPVFYFLTATVVPRKAPVRPGDRGIQVERWYESFDTGRPVTEAAEGSLVRVRLRITVPAERHFVILDDALPGGLEAVDLSLRTVGGVGGPGAADSVAVEPDAELGGAMPWVYGSWDAGWWSPFDHREMRDERVVFAATRLWPGSYTATYLARATTPGTFVRPPAHAEEMYNPAVFGESDGGVFTVRASQP
jgi:uncharacterized protein YfaS (alpha-2-macroglobulin family)